MPDVTRYALDLPLQATLDSSGNGSAQCGPAQGSEVWVVRRYVCAASSGCTINLYKNIVTPGSQFDQTFRGANDVGSLEQHIQPGEQVLVRWQDGQPGAVVSITFYGDRLIRGQWRNGVQ